MYALSYFSKLDDTVLSNKFVEVEVPEDPTLFPVVKTEKIHPILSLPIY